jgi:anti-sigma regulatory factor (Ser/Thr protein kinase)
MADSLALRTEENRLCIGGGLSITEFRRVLAAEHSLTNDRGYSDIIVDFSQCTFTHAPPMIALAALALNQKRQGIDYSLLLPSDPSLQRLFLNSNWAHFIDPERYPRSQYSPNKHNPMTQFHDSGEQALLVDKVMNTLLSNFSGFERSHLRAIEWSLNEITDNVLVHAQSPVGGLIQVTAIKSKKKVEFVVGDAGIGIAKSLRSTHPKISSDVDALSQAIQEGVTRDIAIGQGNGLYGSYCIAAKSGSGNFSIHADRATLYYTENSGMHSRTEQIPIKSSVVICGIDYSNSLLLEEVLRFDGKPHEPTDLIEIQYENVDNHIDFKIRQEASSVGSRVAGTPVRTKLLNLVKVTGAHQIVVDFDGINLISSSFADEVFGKLFISLGALEFSSKFQFKNIDPLVRKLIDKAIMQRVSTGT